jgi:hypothetical protein
MERYGIQFRNFFINLLVIDELLHQGFKAIGTTSSMWLNFTGALLQQLYSICNIAITPY